MDHAARRMVTIGRRLNTFETPLVLYTVDTVQIRDVIFKISEEQMPFVGRPVGSLGVSVIAVKLD